MGLFNLFKKKPKISKLTYVYGSILSKVETDIKESVGACDKKEIAALMYVIADLSLMEASKNRDAALNILDYLLQNQVLKDQTDLQYFKTRVMFYGQFVCGKQPYGECILMPLPQEEDVILSCLTAYGDILLNPDRLIDYDNALPLDPDESIEVFDLSIAITELLMTKLYESMVTLFMIYKKG